MNSVSIVAAFYLDSQMDSWALGLLSEGLQFPAAPQLRLPPQASLAITSLQKMVRAIFCALLSLTAKLFKALLMVTCLNITLLLSVSPVIMGMNGAVVPNIAARSLPGVGPHPLLQLRRKGASVCVPTA